ncbi:hypothetical protein D9M68_303310 [compost metagenome]
MVYASRDALIERFGLDAVLVVADRDGDGVVDDAVIDKALADASAELDTYVGRLYRLPLVTVPEVLSRLCCDVALYRLSADAGSYTEEKRKRYEDAERLLRRIASGEVTLGLPTPPEEESSGFAFFESQPKRFGDLL